MGIQCNYQVAKTFTIAELSKHHSKELVPACEMFDISVTIVFAYVIIKLSSVQKYGKLRKNVSVLVHMQPQIMTAKVDIQIRFISKHHVIDYISTISKNYLSTFTGQ